MVILRKKEQNSFYPDINRDKSKAREKSGAFYPEVPLIVDAKGCAGVTVQSHLNVPEAMKACLVKMVNE